jgi:acetyltransferase-like isoleucine patch superfamily enzyme
MNPRPSRVKRALLYRLYLLTMRGESMNWLPVRRCLLNALLGRKHRRLQVFADVFIEGLDGLTIGDNVSINRGCNISAEGGLTIGDDVAIGHSSTILTTEHGFSAADVPIKSQPLDNFRTFIGPNCWLGARVCILAGVSLARGTIVGAGAVVKHSVTDPDCTVAGVPARLIKRRVAESRPTKKDGR